MAISDIIFERSVGGLQRELPGEDHISGLVYYGTKPAGFGTSNFGQVFSLDQAEDLGITQAGYGVLHYHISEFFRINENGNLYLAIYPESAAATFSGIRDLQLEAGGKIRQVGVFTLSPLTTAMVTTLNDVIESIDAEHMPLSAGLSADISAITLNDLPDLKSLGADKVSVVIGQSGQGEGADLYATSGKSVGTIGAWLGSASLAGVHESIGWVEKFNVAGTELDVVSFANGATYKSTTRAQLASIEDKRYTFLIKHVGTSGSFFNADYTASTGDYERLAFNRAIDKAIRGIRAALIPSLNAPVLIDPATGKLSRDTIDVLEVRGNQPISEMLRNGEISGGRLTINPAQNVLSTDTITCVVNLVPIGVSKNIKVSIGFKTKLS